MRISCEEDKKSKLQGIFISVRCMVSSGLLVDWNYLCSVTCSLDSLARTAFVDNLLTTVDHCYRALTSKRPVCLRVAHFR